MVSSTVEERIFVHLYRYHEYRSKRVVPYEISQPGMADAVGVTRPYLSQVLKKILENRSEHVKEELKHVENLEQRRKVYFLTAEGFRKAQELIKEFKNEKITVLTSDGKDEILLKDMEEYIEGDDPLLTALSRIDENDVLDLTAKEDIEEDIFVDREEELKELQHISKEAFDEGGKVLFIVGDSGVGKTRLVSEFKEEITKKDVIFLSGKAYFKSSDPYLPFKKAFEDLSEEDKNDIFSDLAPQDKIKLSPDKKEELNSRRRSRFFEITKDLRALAEKRPLIISLDDLQWADSATLQFIHYLSENLEDSPVLLIGTFRPHDPNMDGLLKEISQRIKREDRYNELVLKPLRWKHTKKIITGLLGVSEVPADFINLIHDLSEGNPLFTIECVKELQEQGDLGPKKNRYPTEAGSVNIPDVINEMIERRFDQLPDKSERLIQVGSVIGEVIPLELLLKSSGIDELDAFDHIDILLGMNIWDELPEKDMYTFTHSLVHLAAYDSIPEIKKKRLHKKVGEYIEETYEEDLEEHYSSLADHFEKAKERDKAVSYYRKAGEQAEKLYALEDALEKYQNALKLLDGKEKEDVRSELHESVGDINSFLGDLSSSQDHYEEVLEGTDDDLIEQRMYRKLARTWEIKGDFEKAKDLIDKGLEAQDAESVETCELYEIKGWILMQRGDLKEAEKTFKKEKRISQEIGSEKQRSSSNHNLGTLMIHKGKYDEGKKYLEKAIQLREEIGDERGVAKSLNNLGVIYKRRDEIMRALETYERCLEMEKKVGDRSGTAATLANLGSLRYINGDLVAADDNFNRALEYFESFGDKRNISKVMRNLGLIEFERGDMERALDHYEKGLSLKEEIGDKHGKGMVLTDMANVHILKGELEEATDLIEEASEVFEDIDDSKGIALVNRVRGDISREKNRSDEAIEAYEKSYETLKELDESFENLKNCSRMAETFIEKGDLEKANEFVDVCLDISEELDTDYGMPIYWKAKGSLLREEGNTEESIKYLKKAVISLEKSERKLALAETYHELGKTYLEKDRKEGESYLNKAKERFEDMGL